MFLRIDDPLGYGLDRPLLVPLLVKLLNNILNSLLVYVNRGLTDNLEASFRLCDRQRYVK